MTASDIHYEMLWDCPACGTRGLLGVSHRHCPACGAAQNPEQRYFPPPGQEVEVRNHVYSGIDWRCAYCDSPNAAAAKFCVNCGAGQDGSTPVALKTDGDGVASPPPAPAEPTAAPGRGHRRLYAIVASLIATLAALATFLFSTTETSVTVAAQNWERSIAIERYGPAQDSAWCDSLPGGAYKVSRSREVRSHNRVPDGQDCTERRVDKGDGSFIKQQECSPRYRDEPVYGDRCHYTINRWQLDRTAVATQMDGPQPDWPALSLMAGAGDTLGAEREGARQESYTVTLAADGEQWTCKLAPELWQRLRSGTQTKVAVRKLGGADCDSLR